MGSCVYLLSVLLFSYLMIFALCSLQSPESSGLYLSVKANNTGPINLMVILGKNIAESVNEKEDAPQPSKTSNLSETSQKTKEGTFITFGTAQTELVETLNEIPLVYSGISGLSTSEIQGYKYKPTFGYYKFHLDAATWNTAKQVCESEGAHLAIINSEEERDMLIDFWSKTRLDAEYDRFEPDFGTIFSVYSKVEEQRQFYIFLGLHDQNEEGKFETIFGEAIQYTGFDKWNNYEPNDKYPGEDCGSLNFYSGYLNDIECDAKLRFICEREI